MIVTRDDEVLSSAPFPCATLDLAGLMSCTYEEADTRMSVHATDGAGSHFVLQLANHPFRYLDATAMAQALGDAKCGGLPAFRALTGCDVTSPLAGNGKRTAWTAWDANDDATSAMCRSYTLKNANYRKCHECSSHH